MLILYDTNDSLLVPTRAHPTDAGADLRSADNIVIRPHNAELVNTGVRLEIPDGYFGMVVSRSGHSKHRISLANRVGIIDSSYRGDIMVRIENLGDSDFAIHKYDRIAQLIIVPCLLAEFSLGELSTTDRGEGGFGSTGTK